MSVWWLVCEIDLVLPVNWSDQLAMFGHQPTTLLTLNPAPVNCDKSVCLRVGCELNPVGNGGSVCVDCGGVVERRQGWVVSA
jgi:hypothetical protein